LPAYEFSGLTSAVYPETRDANSRPLGTVDHGDRRFFDDGPPDGMWSEVTGEQDPPADGEGPGGEGEAPPEDPAPQSGQPVPPAVIPA
jgi:hypothetical protein